MWPKHMIIGGKSNRQYLLSTDYIFAIKHCTTKESDLSVVFTAHLNFPIT